MNKNKSHKKEVKKGLTSKENKNDSNKTNIIILTSLLAIVYFIYSFYSKGVYQHDEIGHYLTMKSFWNDPNSILSNWSKPGYKLLYAFPSLLSLKFILFINCIVCALTVYFTYNILKKYNSQYALLAIFFLGLAPMWFQLSFRNYSEYTAVLMLVLTLWNHQREKFIYAALFVSYASFIRQELFLINGLYFLYLCYKKQFIPALLTGTFALVTQIWGYLITGNFLFLYDFLFGYASEISGKFLKARGLQRIPVLSVALFGAITPLLFIVYIGSSLLQKKNLHYIILVPFFAIYTYYSLGDATWFSKGIPINTRQLIIILPFLTIFAVLGLDRFDLLNSSKKKWLLVFLIPYLALVGIYMSKEHNWVVLLDEVNYSLLFISMAVMAALYLPLKIKTKIILFSFIALFSLVASFKKFELTEEDKTMRRVANYYERVGKSKGGIFNSDNPVYASHAVFMYHQSKAYHEFEKITEESVKNIKKGSVIFWDSHYSHRPKQDGLRVKESYFLDRANEFRLINTFQSKDNRVKVSVFYKFNERDTIFEKGIELSNNKQFKESISLFQQALLVNPNNQSAFYYLGLAYQNIGDPNLAFQNYSKCLALNPNHQKALFNRGALYSNYGKFNEALVDLDKYIKLNTQDVNAYFYLGNVYFGLKKYDESIQYFNIVLRFNKQFSDAHFNIGMAQIYKNNKSAACLSFEEAKKLGNARAEDAIQKYCK